MSAVDYVGIMQTDAFAGFTIRFMTRDDDLGQSPKPRVGVTGEGSSLLWRSLKPIAAEAVRRSDEPLRAAAPRSWYGQKLRLRTRATSMKSSSVWLSLPALDSTAELFDLGERLRLAVDQNWQTG